MAGSYHRPSPPPIPSAGRPRSPTRRVSCSPVVFPTALSSFSSSIGATQALSAAPPILQHHGPAGAADAGDRGVRQRSWGSCVSEITNRNTGRKVWVGSFQGADQAVRAYDIANVHLHGSECSELNFPLEVSGPVPELEPEGLRFISARKRREDREARERLDAERRAAAMAVALAGLNPELVEVERKVLEGFAEAKRKADAATGKQVKKEEAGSSAAPAPTTVKEEEGDWEDMPPTSTPAVIELDSDSSYDWDDE